MKIATTTSHSRTLPQNDPSTESRTYGSPPTASSSPRLGAAIRAPSSMSPPPMADTVNAKRMVRGATRRGFLVSSASSPAEPKPTMT